MTYQILTSLCALMIVVACQPTSVDAPVVGGPCTYETATLQGTVASVGDEGLLVSTANREIIVPQDYIGEIPEVGEGVTVVVKQITKGTCTPMIYSLQRRP